MSRLRRSRLRSRRDSEDSEKSGRRVWIDSSPVGLRMTKMKVAKHSLFFAPSFFSNEGHEATGDEIFPGHFVFLLGHQQ